MSTLTFVGPGMADTLKDKMMWAQFEPKLVFTNVSRCNPSKKEIDAFKESPAKKQALQWLAAGEKLQPTYYDVLDALETIKEKRKKTAFNTSERKRLEKEFDPLDKDIRALYEALHKAVRSAKGDGKAVANPTLVYNGAKS